MQRSKRFFFWVVGLQAVLGFIFLALTVASNFYLKTLTAKTLSDVATADLKKDDLREVLYTLAIAQKNNFRAAAYFDRENRRVFSVPASVHPEYFNERSAIAKFFDPSIKVEIFSDEEQTQRLGYFLFLIPSMNVIPIGLFLWLGWIALTSPLVKRQHDLLVSMSQQKSMAELGQQVSHDIRSPLSALNMVLNTSESFSADHRKVAKHALTRINDIANDLLSKSKTHQGQTLIHEEASSTKDSTEMNEFMKKLVEEKKMEFAHTKKHISFETASADAVMIEIDEVELARSVSNLINNSIEALQDGGLVRVHLRAYKNQATIIVSDNGSGIPENIVSQLGHEKLTFGKSGTSSGNGLGVYHARQTILKAGGSFNIQSKLNEGTMVSMTLPRRHFSRPNSPEMSSLSS